MSVTSDNNEVTLKIKILFKLKRKRLFKSKEYQVV